MKISTKKFTWLIVVISVVYILSRLTYELNLHRGVDERWDTPAYIQISTKNFFSAEFFTSPRPFIYPLVLKVFQLNLEAVFDFQVLVSALAWGFLAWSTAFSIKNHWVGLVSFVIILLFSLDRHISGWDHLILTESLSISLMAILVACWLWLLRSWKPVIVAGLIVIGLLSTFIRDTNAWFMMMQAGLLMVALVILLVGRRKGKWHFKHPVEFLLISVTFLAGFFINNYLANQGGRWFFPFQNILIERILPSQSATSFFSACGLPNAGELRSQLINAKYSRDPAVHWNDTPEYFQKWRDENGEACYAKWLIQNPGDTITHPFVDFGTTLSFPDVNRYFDEKNKPILPITLSKIIYPGFFPLWLWVAKTIIVLGLGVWKGAYRKNIAWWLVFGFALLEYPHYVLIWHADAVDLPRHSLLVSVLFQYSLWLIAALTIDGFLTKGKIGGRKNILKTDTLFNNSKQY